MRNNKSLQDELRIIAGMVSLGEKIKFGKDSQLMIDAADKIDELIETLEYMEANTERLHRALEFIIRQHESCIHTISQG